MFSEIHGRTSEGSKLGIYITSKKTAASRHRHASKVDFECLQEIQALAASGVHKHIVRYYFAWLEEQGESVHFYVQLEKCENSLGQRFSVEGKAFKEAELVEILKQVILSGQRTIKSLVSICKADISLQFRLSKECAHKAALRY